MPGWSKHGTSSVSEARGTKSTPAAIVIGDTATLIVAIQSRRIGILMANAGQSTVYVGSDNTVTVNNGIPILANGNLSDIESYDAWWGIVAAGNQGDLRVVTTVVAGA